MPMVIWKIWHKNLLLNTDKKFKLQLDPIHSLNSVCLEVFSSCVKSGFFLDNYIQKMKKQYSDTRTSREAMGRLRTDLRDVQNIMVTNIQDVMSRGESLQGLFKLSID